MKAIINRVKCYLNIHKKTKEIKTILWDRYGGILEPCLFFRNEYNRKCNTRNIDSQITNDNLFICAMNQALFVRKGGKYAFKRLEANPASRENDGRYMLMEEK